MHGKIKVVVLVHGQDLRREVVRNRWQNVDSVDVYNFLLFAFVFGMTNREHCSQPPLIYVKLYSVDHL
jgi:hypothetical protein